MAEKLDLKHAVTFEELLRSCLYEQEALMRVLVRKGLVSQAEVLEGVKAVRREGRGSVKHFRRKKRRPPPQRWPWP